MTEASQKQGEYEAGTSATSADDQQIGGGLAAARDAPAAAAFPRATTPSTVTSGGMLPESLQAGCHSAEIPVGKTSSFRSFIPTKEVKETLKPSPEAERSGGGSAAGATEPIAL